jgi:hypothetical protein
MLNGFENRLSTGFRTCRLANFPTGRGFPAPLRSQCFSNGGRSCLPLRDSSGFVPDSLLDNERRLARLRDALQSV